jgi:ABC-2 type transport system ATP-binding protein
MADRVGLIREGRLDLVDSVENLRSRAFTHVEATLAEPPPPGAFTGVAGVERVDQDGDVVRFALEGEIDALLKALTRFHVKALDVREADLEDVFLARYRGEEPDAP